MSGWGSPATRFEPATVLAVLAMLAALRVVAGGCAPVGLLRSPTPFAARRGLGIARSGRESRCPDRTGKLGFRRCSTRRRVTLRVQRDRGHRRPVPGWPAPAPRIALARGLVDGMAGAEQAAILTGMALCRGDVADGAVPMLVIVPVDEPRGPGPGRLQVGTPWCPSAWPRCRHAAPAGPMPHARLRRAQCGGPGAPHARRCRCRALRSRRPCDGTGRG